MLPLNTLRGDEPEQAHLPCRQKLRFLTREHPRHPKDEPDQHSGPGALPASFPPLYTPCCGSPWLLPGSLVLFLCSASVACPHPWKPYPNLGSSSFQFTLHAEHFQSPKGEGFPTLTKADSGWMSYGVTQF